MKYQSCIYNSRCEPFIGPRQSDKPQQVATVIVVFTILLAIVWAVTWLACELKNLS